MLSDVSVSQSLVVIPTYNECENIESIVRAILGQSADFEVLVVDDNSPDGTGQLVESLSVEHPSRVHLDIETDDVARNYIERINRGYQSVPTILFPDGSILVEPSSATLSEKLTKLKV